METGRNIKAELLNDGYAIINNFFSDEEIEGLQKTISFVAATNPSFSKTKDLFSIRQFFKEVPDSFAIVFNNKLNSLIKEIMGNDFFVVKSIYFDKPEESNWFVAYHQDLTISVDKKFDIKGFGLWTKKQNQFAVQPPLDILQDNFTARIHLDDTNEENGALKVIPKSHLKGIYRTETIDWSVETENICRVRKGGIMFMKPLLLHSSNKTTNNNKRQVIHIEFSRSILPEGLNWSEFKRIKNHN